MLVYDDIVEGYEVECDSDIISYALGFVSGEVLATEQTIKYKRYIDNVNGIDIYYDYGADYYFFTDSE